MSPPSDIDHDLTRITVRLLGALRVTRADGTVADTSSWRTGKTMDLLRILALGQGKPVRLQFLIDQLWPAVPQPRGRASLRTAASQIRHTVGHDCVTRSLDGLALIDAEVDVATFLSYTHQMDVAAVALDHQRVVALNREAQGLYGDDFHAYDDDAAWASDQRELLIAARLKMLCAAAASAVEVSRFREALELATEAVQIDPISEPAHRAMMRSLAELGEVSGALRAFAVYRHRLSEELGADPSPQTMALHLDLLRGRI